MKSFGAKRLENIKEYYFSAKLREIEEMNRNGDEVINLGIGSPDLPPHEGVVEKLSESAMEPGHHGYQSYRGIPSLRNAFAGWYQDRYGVTLDPEGEVLPLMGSKEGIFYISMAMINEGDQVLVPNPGYPTYTSVSNMVGGEVITYDLQPELNWLPDLNRLENSDLSRVKIMWVNYPHMPTGAKANTAFFQELVEFGKRNSIMICHDNPYSFILNDHPLSLLEIKGAKEFVLELNSLSKSHNMAGWRVGLIAGSKKHIDLINMVTSNIQSGMFLPVQHAAIQALENPDSWYQGLNLIYSRRRDEVEEIARLLGCTFDKNQGGLFVWAKIPEGYDSFTFSDMVLRKSRIFITPGSIFGTNGSAYIRISLCSPEKILREAKHRILENFN